MGKLQFLGIEVINYAHGALLSQQSYIFNILKRKKMLEAKPISSYAFSTNLSASEGEPFTDQALFKSTFGFLQYLSLTMLDIAFVPKPSQPSTT